jgi:hypothetical protein
MGCWCRSRPAGRYQDQGIGRVIVSLLPNPAAKTWPVLDRWTELIRRVKT